MLKAVIDEITRLALLQGSNHKSVSKIADILMFPLGCTWKVHDGTIVGLHFLKGFIDSSGSELKSDDGKAPNARNKYVMKITKLKPYSEKKWLNYSMLFENTICATIKW